MADDIFAEVDFSEFTEAINLYSQVTRKTEAQIVDKMAIDVCFKAAAATKIAKVGEIPNHREKRRHYEYENKLFHALASEQGKVRGKGNRAESLKIYQSRREGKGYARAVWYSLAAQLGANLRGKFKVKQVKGTNARPNNPVATLKLFPKTGSKRVESFSRLMTDSLQEGVNHVARSKKAYAEGKLQEIADKFSA